MSWKLIAYNTNANKQTNFKILIKEETKALEWRRQRLPITIDNKYNTKLDQNKTLRNRKLTNNIKV